MIAWQADTAATTILMLCRACNIRGSLTLANQHDSMSPDQLIFTSNHKATYQQHKAQEQRTCSRCQMPYGTSQQGGCKEHPGAMAYRTEHEGTPEERAIFDHYECCRKTVSDNLGERVLQGPACLGCHWFYPAAPIGPHGLEPSHWEPYGVDFPFLFFSFLLLLLW